MGFGGGSGALALERAALLEAAYGRLLPPGATAVTVPNDFGETGSPADG